MTIDREQLCALIIERLGQGASSDEILEAAFDRWPQVRKGEVWKALVLAGIEMGVAAGKVRALDS